MVLAESAALGEDALEHITLDIEPLPAVTDCEISARGTPLLFEPQGTNRSMVFTAECGDVDAAFRDAPYVRRETLRTDACRLVAMRYAPSRLLAATSGAPDLEY